MYQQNNQMRVSSTPIADALTEPFRTGGWIQTFTGGQFFPMDPKAEEMSIEDIASALSKICRFNGHCNKFYSVAQHSVLVSQRVPPQFALEGLLHDAAEAYITDLPRPIKIGLDDYARAEQNIMRVVAERFNLCSYLMPESVKDVDEAMLATEKRDLMAKEPAPWTIEGLPYSEVITPWTPEESEARFMERYNELKRV